MKAASKGSKRLPKGVRDNGQRPSEEYTRFESLMKRLVRTPKPNPDKATRKRG